MEWVLPNLPKVGFPGTPPRLSDCKAMFTHVAIDSCSRAQMKSTRLWNALGAFVLIKTLFSHFTVVETEAQRG